MDRDFGAISMRSVCRSFPRSARGCDRSLSVVLLPGWPARGMRFRGIRGAPGAISRCDRAAHAGTAGPGSGGHHAPPLWRLGLRRATNGPRARTGKATTGAVPLAAVSCDRSAAWWDCGAVGPCPAPGPGRTLGGAVRGAPGAAMSKVLLLLRALRAARPRAWPRPASARGLRTAAPRRAFAKELFLGTLRKVGPQGWGRPWGRGVAALLPTDSGKGTARHQAGPSPAWACHHHPRVFPGADPQPGAAGLE